MTGWRVGYAVAPPPINDLIARLEEPTVSVAPRSRRKRRLPRLPLNPK